MLSHLLFANGLNVSFYCLSINGVLLPTPRSQVTIFIKHKTFFYSELTAGSHSLFKYLSAIVHKMLLLLRKMYGLSHR